MRQYWFRIQEQLTYNTMKTNVTNLNQTGIIDELTEMLENIPPNRPLYKDSGIWQIRTEDMSGVIFQQGVNESFFDFIKRAFEKENSFMGAFEN